MVPQKNDDTMTEQVLGINRAKVHFYQQTIFYRTPFESFFLLSDDIVDIIYISAQKNGKFAFLSLLFILNFQSHFLLRVMVQKPLQNPFRDTQ